MLSTPTLSRRNGRDVWIMPNGRILPVISGGADEGDPPPDPPEPTPDPTPDPEPDDKPLGPAGEKALEALKEERRQLKAKLSEHESELASLREAQMTEQERAIEQARKEAAESARSEALGEANDRLFRAELRALTAGKLTDTAITDLTTDADVAVKLLGLGQIPVTDTGDIDSEAISAAVTSYTEARPHLAASATPVPGIDQGSRGTARTVETLDEAIAKAEADGDSKLSLALKTQKLAALPRR